MNGKMLAALRHQAIEDVVTQAQLQGPRSLCLVTFMSRALAGPIDVLGAWGTYPGCAVVHPPQRLGSADKTSLPVIQMPVCIHRAVLRQITQRSRLPAACNP